MRPEGVSGHEGPWIPGTSPVTVDYLQNTSDSLLVLLHADGLLQCQKLGMGCFGYARCWERVQRKFIECENSCFKLDMHSSYVDVGLSYSQLH